MSISSCSISEDNFITEPPNNKGKRNKNIEKSVLDGKKMLKNAKARNNYRDKVSEFKSEFNYENPKVQSDYPKVVGDETEIIGKERRLLFMKITQYQTLFPEQTKHFKINKNASIETLKEYIKELSDIVSISGMDEFVLTGILELIESIEFVSKYTRYNITNLSKKLRQDKQFDLLARQFFIKYSVFSNVCPELKMIFLIILLSSQCKVENDFAFLLPKTEEKTEENV